MTWKKVAASNPNFDTPLVRRQAVSNSAFVEHKPESRFSSAYCVQITLLALYETRFGGFVARLDAVAACCRCYICCSVSGGGKRRSLSRGEGT